MALEKEKIDQAKEQVREFWNKAACGEKLYLENTDLHGYAQQAEERYRLEPIILTFADFNSASEQKVLEIGVGLGADHQKFAESGADLVGIDLTERAVNHTRARIKHFDLFSILSVGDAENLSFPDEDFDLVYSWGVLHHSPNTKKAITEVHRVLKKGGKAKIMIYHKWSMVGFMLWLRYAFLMGHFWRPLSSIYAEHLESPGTKAFSVSEANDMFSCFDEVKISTHLGHGDLLESNVGQRHRGVFLKMAKQFWPRWFIRRFLTGSGLGMLIEARK